MMPRTPPLLGGLLVLVLLLAAGPVTADIDAGLDWLVSRDAGSGVHRAGDLAGPVDTHQEAWQTAYRLEARDRFPSLIDEALTGQDGSHHALARRAFIELSEGRSAAESLGTLSAARNPDGGNPSHAGHESDPMTTAWLLRALDRNGQGAGTAASLAVGYLLSAQNEDGGWPSIHDGPSSVFATAQIARVLVDFENRFTLTTPLDNATAFLLSRQAADGSFGELHDTALAVEALVALRADRDQWNGAIDALTAAQRPDGSFGGDAYLTSVALRALFVASQPVTDPELAGVTGTIVSADTDLPISGAEVALTGPSPATLNSNNSGTVYSNTLGSGAYQAAISYPGMRTVTFDLTLPPGEVVDLGRIRLYQDAAGDGLGIVRGVVTDTETGDPIAGATVALDEPQTEVTTDMQGRYQLLQLPVGPLEITASADGYASFGSRASLSEGAILELSIGLTPQATPQPDSLVRGTVIDGSTDAPLPGVTVAVVDGAPVVDTDTDGNGAYQLPVDADGLVTLRASKSDFDPVEVTTLLTPNQIFEFSPTLYPAGTTPDGANQSEITGVVVNQANRRPISNALVTVADPGGQQVVRTDSEGRFTVSELAGPTTEIVITADAFDPATLVVPVLPLESRDVGEVGLKPTVLDFYFPDLVIVSTGLTENDPNSFELDDSVTVEIANRGTSGVEQGFDLLAFQDTNNNRRFDDGLDPEIGSARVERDLVIGDSVEVEIAVTAQQAFRDAPFELWVDSGNEVPEEDEENNVGSTLLGCRVTPAFIGDDGIHEVWRWEGLSSNPDVNSVNQVPVVGQLTDDNGDGAINEYDIPDIVFTAGGRGSSHPGQTALVAISGADGSEIWTRTDIQFSHFSSPALGDIDNDGIAEIVVNRNYRQELIAFEHDGQLKWRTALDGPGVPVPLFPPPAYVYDLITIVNLEGDNEAEVIYGREAFRGLTGEQLWQGELDAGGVNGGVPTTHANGIGSIAADFDLDGIVEVLAGRTMYDFEGRTVWHRGDIQPETWFDLAENEIGYSGYTGVGNFDLDDFPEIVLTVGEEMHLLEHSGESIWGPVFAPDFGELGAPSIADLDADGLPEIIVSSNERLTVFETDGTVKWTFTIRDRSGVTSATVFDFENDGLLEVIHIDERDFRILDARTGTLLYETRHTSRTVFELPVVADVDGDREAEILLTGFDDDLVAGTTPGLRAFEARGGAWADAGSVWGSQSFHITEVNEDGTVPLLETPSWLTHNTYRVQRSPLPDPLGEPDFTLGDLQLLDQGPGLDPFVRVRVGNAGPVRAHEPARLGIFRGDPEQGGVLLAERRLDTLQPTRFQIVDMGEVPLSGSGELYAVVDHPGRAKECREGNNHLAVPFAAINGDGSLQVTTDATEYAPDDTVVISSAVSNQGGAPASFSVNLQLLNADGEIAVTFDAIPFESVAAGASVTIDRDWVADDVLGGTYTLQGELVNGDGDVVDQASAVFSISGGTSGPAAELSLQMYQVDFAGGETAEVTLRAENTSDDTVIESPEIDLQVTGPDGVVLEDTLLLDDMLPGAFHESFFVAEGTQDPATYTVSAQLHSGLTGEQLASDSLEFTRLSSQTRDLRANVSVAAPQVIAGALQTCLFTVDNIGQARLDGLDLRKRVVRTSDGQGLFSVREGVDIPVDDGYLSVEDIDTTGYAPDAYLCTIELGPGPDWQVLAADGFSVNSPPPPGISVEPATLETSEGGQSAAFSIVLDSPPGADVTVPLAVSDSSEWSLSTSSVTFTPASWNLARTVVAQGVDDDELDGDQTGQISLLPATSADAAYGGLDAADIAVTNLDDDGPRVTVSPTTVATSEDGEMDTFDIAINGEPTAPVTIDLINPDSREWQLSTQQLVFDDQNWQQPQTVTVTGVDDAVADGAQTGLIEVRPAESADPRFDGLDGGDVEASNADNDSVAIEVTPTEVATTEGGAGSGFVVRLSAEPSSEVVIPVGFSDPTEWQVLAVDVRLDESNWDSGETVVVLPVDDAEMDGVQTATLPLEPAQSADARYQGIDPDDVTLTNNDNDGAQILVTPTEGLIVDESGATAQFEVRLTRAAASRVTIPVASLDTSEFLPSTGAVEITPQDGTAPVTVTVSGVDDDLADGNIAGLIELGSGQSADPAYSGIDVSDVAVTNLDDETVQVSVAPDGVLETDESGTTGVITVSLNYAPTADVSIALGNPDGSEWALDAAELIFTPADWSDRQLTVTGVDDDQLDGDVVGSIALAPVVSDDPRYAGLDPVDVPAVNRDDDALADGALSIEGIDLTTSESGDTGRIDLVLDRAPEGQLLVNVGSSNADEIVVEPTSVVFQPGETVQGVTLLGVDEPVDDGDRPVTITAGVQSSEDPAFRGVTAAPVTATNLDDDTAAVVLELNGPDSIREGESTRLDLRLDSRPLSPVTVTLAARPSDDSAREFRLLPEEVVIEPQAWDEPTEIVFEAVANASADPTELVEVLAVASASGDALYEGLSPDPQSIEIRGDGGAAPIPVPVAPRWTWLLLIFVVLLTASTRKFS